jgi:hypothetical protein
MQRKNLPELHFKSYTGWFFLTASPHPLKTLVPVYLIEWLQIKDHRGHYRSIDLVLATLGTHLEVFWIGKCLE